MRIMKPSEETRVNIDKEKFTINKSNQWTYDRDGDFWYYTINEGYTQTDIVIASIFISVNDGDSTDYANLFTLLSNGLYIDTSLEDGTVTAYCNIDPNTVFTEPYNGFSVQVIKIN